MENDYSFLVTVWKDHNILLGTGFFISNRIILTAGHILPKGGDVSVRLYNEELHRPARILERQDPREKHINLDYGVIEITDDHFIAPSIVQLSDKKVKPQSLVYGSGYTDVSGNLTLKPITGKLLGRVMRSPKDWNYEIKTDVEISMCQSGFPFLTHDQRVFAIQRGKTATGTRSRKGDYTKAVATPIELIKSESQTVFECINFQKSANLDRRASALTSLPRNNGKSARIILLLRTFSVGDCFDNRIVGAIKRKLESKADELRLNLNEISWLNKGSQIVRWDIEDRFVGDSANLDDFFGPNAPSGIAEESQPLMRVIVDSCTGLSLPNWNDLMLPHGDISHGVSIRVQESHDHAQIINDCVFVKGDDVEKLSEEVASRIHDLFLDINIFYKYSDAADFFDSPTSKKQFDISKQTYLKAKSHPLKQLHSLSSLSRIDWTRALDRRLLKKEWDQFYAYAIRQQRSNREDGSLELEGHINATLAALQTRRGLAGRISRDNIVGALNHFGTPNASEPLVAALIIKKPRPQEIRDDLIKTFGFSEWKMQGRSLTFFSHAKRHSLLRYRRWIALLTIKPD